MGKKVVSLLLAGFMALSLAACGSTGTGSASGSAVQQSGSASASTSGAALEDTVVVYTTHSEAMLEEIAAAFTEKTGVQVEFINLKGELADRVRGEMKNPQADIMYGGDTATYMLLKDEGAYTVSNPSWGGDLDSAFKDGDGFWYGTIQTPVMLFYNTEQLSAADAPKDWGDLADAKYAGKIVSRDSLSSSMRSTICNLMYFYSQQNGEDSALEYLAALDANTKSYYSSGSMMFEAIGKGEAAISFGVLSDITTNRDENGMPLEIIDAASGSVVITDCIAALKDSPHPAAAQAFLEFAGSAEVQTMLANDFNRMPTLKAALANSPAWMQIGYAAMDVDWSAIAANQSDWLSNWETNICNADKAVASK